MARCAFCASISTNDYFRPDVLDLAQHRVGGAGRESHMTEDIAAHSGSFQTMLEHRQPFSVFGQKSYSYTLHWLHSSFLNQYVIEI